MGYGEVRRVVQGYGIPAPASPLPADLRTALARRPAEPRVVAETPEADELLAAEHGRLER